MTKDLIIGTAGHVDHGKTTLIRALTGLETDRLKEEKERGISIELGFAHFMLPNGIRAGIVDVPGHERFLRNMLAGVGGMDMVLLVIAADEGIMPQTKEHLDILELLGVQIGIVVLTKCDAVDTEWLELVEEDIRSTLSTSVLRDAKIMRVSSVQGIGIPQLIQQIEALAAAVNSRPHAGAFRMPIDRIFSMQGFGTVVTGTLWTGMISEGDRAVIEPGGIDVRIRGVQAYGKKVQTARAGQRTALNIAGADITNLTRGHVIAQPNTVSPGRMLDARFRLLKDAPIKELRNGTRIRLYTGTSETIGRIYLLDREQLLPGEDALVQLRLEDEVAAGYGDRYVVRIYSPMLTIGGGVLLNISADKRRRFDEQGLLTLEQKETGTPESLIRQCWAQDGGILTISEILKQLSQIPEEEITHWLEQLVRQDILVQWDIDGATSFLSREVLVRWESQVKAYLTQYHRANPLKIGPPREELRQKVLAKVTQRQLQVLLVEWQHMGAIVCEGPKVRLSSHQVHYVGTYREWREKLEGALLHQLFAPPDMAPLLIGPKGKVKEAVEVWESLLEQGIIIRIADSMYFHQQAIAKIQALLVGHFQKQEQLTPGEFRDLVGSSRKYCVPLLEYFDSIGITKRYNEYRIQCSKNMEIMKK